MGLAHQEFLPAGVAAVADAVNEPLADGPAVPDLRTGHWPLPPRSGPGAVRGDPHLAPVPAPGVRHAGHRAGAGLRTGRGQRRRPARVRGVHAALLAAAALAGWPLQRRRIRGHLEPPVVPGLSLGLQPAAGGPAAAAGIADWPAPAGGPGRPARLEAGAAAGLAAGAVHQCADAGVRVQQRPDP